MLDKSIPHKFILMKRPRGTPLKPYAPPPGFAFHFYRPGDERDWADIESSVLEFASAEAALDYYGKEFAPHPEELKRRQLFLRDADGRAAATISAWWRTAGDRRIPLIHWVAVKPEYQGRGLGKAAVSEGIRLLAELEGDADMYLQTQTWSWKAVNIYLDAGFEFVRNETPEGFRNEYEEAMAIIAGRIRRRQA